ncbi:MAG TPA: ribosome small subunit-dependent GTPase A [Chitinophagaceae bacterium]|jgi:ribosome biogenesis GTPase|nr:ribosome small subunit-dependent GTPase A [Chitinophagaceae bacterium]OPZ17942.1 MAG: putative ribosome biogenesis GTPase RsgA [Bacteroidetes bacterium ADurb.BinA245]HMX78139.1 ribosome small subunit-dependent GTPase A [Chitinophagaceae bacterium]HNA19216.1 ribosome small subunit-dependent GTPase A [Chitinophagaceae bacterium]HNA95870.1 ribosome small subunit-dependent GTPase A [Chitinophagaceae bacterium]
MIATVYKSTGSWYNVKSESGRFFNARMKGVLKIDDITSTNPVAVGDKVNIEIENETEGTAIINEILPRHNYINRQSPRFKHQHHIVAANLDQSILVATLKEPKTSQGFIDRFLVACEMYHVSAFIVFNKSDLYKTKELEKYEQWKTMYETVGYKVLLVSADKNEGIEQLNSILNNKISLLSGHSGVGKSSLLNVLMPGMNRKVQDVSGWSGKGQHTTTFAEMFDLPGGGSIIDTPGMREFGLVDIEKSELSHYFPEMRDRLNGCQFNNCMHINEPDCAIKQAVRQGEIFEDRYVSYVNILESIEEGKW